MKVLPISLPEKLIEKIRNSSKEKGISMAEFLRRVIDRYYEEVGNEKQPRR